jgi:CBS-domain-containing membrane protein
MIVSDAMTREVHHCLVTDNLERVAQLLWEHDVGALPVFADFGRTVAMVTDRDVCMAAYINGGRLRDLPVTLAASRHVYHVRPTDPIESVLTVMKMHRVRRVPVIDIGEHLDGIITIADIVKNVSASLDRSDPLHPEQVARAFAEILRPHDFSRHPSREPAPVARVHNA